MQTSAFTIVRNAIKFAYPVKESILSILPIVDEFVVSVGNSEDDTLELIQSIVSPKIRIIESQWDDTLREHGQVLAVETNKAFDQISADADWAFYLQADEVFHEQYLETTRDALQRWQNEPQVEGLLFNYTHFYGTYDYVGNSRRWYRREIRVIRNEKTIRSYKDAQGFRKNGQKLKVRPVDAEIYHYGWIKHPQVMQEKMKHFHKLWHDDHWVEREMGVKDQYDFSQIDSLQRFTGTHPAVMRERISEITWSLGFDPTKHHLSLKNATLLWLEKLTGKRLGEYRNYKLI